MPEVRSAVVDADRRPPLQGSRRGRLKHAAAWHREARLACLVPACRRCLWQATVFGAGSVGNGHDGRFRWSPRESAQAYLFGGELLQIASRRLASLTHVYDPVAAAFGGSIRVRVFVVRNARITSRCSRRAARGGSGCVEKSVTPLDTSSSPSRPVTVARI